MKKYLVILAALIVLGLNTNAQTEVVYGTVRYDGINNVTKGYFWSTRPEAKEVYEGRFPDNVDVYELTEDYFARFIPSEHNNLDRNYFVLPKGKRVYKKNGNWYLSDCGNQLEYLHPVIQTKIIQLPPVTVPFPVLVHDTLYLKLKPVEQPSESEEDEEVVVTKKKEEQPACNNCYEMGPRKPVCREPQPRFISYRRPYVRPQSNFRVAVNLNVQSRQQPRRIIHRQPQQQQHGRMGGGRGDMTTTNHGNMGGGGGSNNGNQGGGRGN